MRISSDTQFNVRIFLDGEFIGFVRAADDQEGWVDQILTNSYRQLIGYPIAATKEEELKVIRRTGKVEFRSAEPSEAEITEATAQLLETFAHRVRSGEMKITNFNQSRPYERWWAKDKWEYFTLQDMTFSMSYYNPRHQQSELERKDNYLKDNPEAEGPIVEPPFQKEVQYLTEDTNKLRK